MSLVDRIAEVVTRHSVAVVVVVLLVTAGLGAGMGKVDQSSSLEQFQSETTEAQKLDYIEQNFRTGPANTTTVQVVMRDDNVLDKESLLAQLRFEKRLRENETVGETLSESSPPTGIANVVATAAIRAERARELAARAGELQRRSQQLNRTLDGLVTGLDRTRELQRQYDRLNRSLARGQIDNATYSQRAAAIEANLTAAVSTATGPLNETQAATYRELASRARTLQGRLDALNASLAAGEINRTTYRQRAADVAVGLEKVYGGVRAILAPEFRALKAEFTELQERRRAIEAAAESGERPPLDDQIAQIESMNESEIDEVLTTVLSKGGDGSGGRGAFAVMPTGYTPGSAEASATMVVLTQTTESDSSVRGTATDRIVESQNAIQSIAGDALGDRSVVFGAGIISDEIDRSMSDSLLIVGPLALLFVLLVLVIAYRDVVDILLGLFGIAAVLVWTFGFMGWAGFSFNQIFVAVPVLLIGLSIDYAIHVFMRHREERTRVEGVRDSMSVGLASVGVALFFVTATTVIGFLSNLISSVPPIREFGVVSAFGIVAAFVVFGALVPAAKVAIDDALEARGVDRQKRAFGTGGGALGRVLGVGATAARRAPAVVLVLTLLLTAGGAYGATQVDTSFQQSDFLADDPPDWMNDLPEPFAPGEYHAKDALDFVNENFLRQDSQAQILVEGDVTDPDLLDRVDAARERAADSSVVVVLSNGEADVQSPLSVMRQVAATNESFAQTFDAADTDDDGVPDRNVEAVYDALYEVAPDRAQSVVHRTGPDSYEALRLVVSVQGDAEGSAVTEQMRAIADGLDGSGVTVTATGQPIVFELVSDQLLETVVQSLAITLVAVFVFLMVTYRFTDGSATLGFVTLLPVAFSVAWILGTMYLFGIPFNVLTGMITSLTVGLGVAYSIHISERYAHELERQDGGWDAMQTTVTGTGGALLGSAATTVGGFGVLGFAILPPLRQFGIITGLTIVYAFLASVLVLPTLLAVWTRYLGPDVFGGDGDGGGTEVEPEPEPETEGESAVADDEQAVEAGAGDASSVPTGTGTGAETGTGADAGLVTTGPSAGAGRPKRTLDPEYVRPGGRFEVTVTVPAADGPALLRETVAGADLEVSAVEPDPVDTVAAGDTVYVAWGGASGGERRVAYAGTVPETAVDADEYGVDGTVRTRSDTDPVAGPDAVTVVTDIFERILANGDVTADDLRLAGEHLEAGDMSRRQYERICEEWLRPRGEASADRGARADAAGGPRDETPDSENAGAERTGRTTSAGEDATDERATGSGASAPDADAEDEGTGSGAGTDAGGRDGAVDDDARDGDCGEATGGRGSGEDGADDPER